MIVTSQIKIHILIFMAIATEVTIQHQIFAVFLQYYVQFPTMESVNLYVVSRNHGYTLKRPLKSLGWKMIKNHLVCSLRFFKIIIISMTSTPTPKRPMDPLLVSPDFYNKYILLECKQQLLTKYRSGSHLLKINTGFFQRSPIESKSVFVQQIWTCHIPLSCPLTDTIRHDNFQSNLNLFFTNNTLAATKFQAMETILCLRRN